MTDKHTICGIYSIGEEGGLKSTLLVGDLRIMRDKLWRAYYSKGEIPEIEIRQLEADIRVLEYECKLAGVV